MLCPVGQPRTFVNRVLLEQSHAPSSTCYLCCFHAAKADLRFCDRWFGHKACIYYLATRYHKKQVFFLCPGSCHRAPNQFVISEVMSVFCYWGNWDTGAPGQLQDGDRLADRPRYDERVGTVNPPQPLGRGAALVVELTLHQPCPPYRSFIKTPKRWDQGAWTGGVLVRGGGCTPAQLHRTEPPALGAPPDQAHTMSSSGSSFISSAISM